MQNSKTHSCENYFNRGQKWDEEIVAGALASRKRAWAVASVSLVISMLSLAALILLLPLKTFAPYVITVDKHTGYVEMTQGLVSGAMSEDEAITESYLVRYVSMREGYNPAILENNYNTVSLMSADTALKDYKSLWSSANPDNPSVKFGQDKSISIQIKSVSFISDAIASVRFIKTIHGTEGKAETHYNAVIAFRYTDKPMQMKDRFENPLGFQVTSYRINPEIPETRS